ncbi:MAG: hypothetical protein ACKV2T_17180 [Kofleriaceae bacterium]
MRAYFLTRSDEVVAVESMPISLERADEVWFRLVHTTVIESWLWGDAPPELKFGARVLIRPRWEDVRPLRIGLIAERVTARVEAPKSESNRAPTGQPPGYEHDSR